jgi:2-methylcitrate dehydratase PrpD
MLADLARRAGAMTIDRLPEAVLQQARLCILDTLGCIVAGTRTAEAKLVLECLRSAAPAEASVFGTRVRLPLQEAARANGYLGDVLELNDLIGGHASIGNVTAALVLAEATNASGAALLEAVVRGVETTWRIYSTVYPHLRPFKGMGLVPVGIPSSIGAAAAAARLLSLDETKTLQAMAISGALAGWCPAESIFGDGGTMKPMLFGAQPAATALQGAAWAQAGMTGPTHLLDSALGYVATVTSSRGAAEVPAEPGWGLLAPRRKLHACCGYLHASVDAGADLRRLAASSGAGTLEVSLPPYVVEVVAKSRPPLSPNDARFHLQYCLALVLCGADVIVPEHSIQFERWIARAEIRVAMARIVVVAEPSFAHYQQCRLRLLSADGTVAHELGLDAPRGSPGRPLSDAEVVDKFMRLASEVVGEAAAASCRDRVMAIERSPSVGIAESLRPAAT